MQVVQIVQQCAAHVLEAERQIEAIRKLEFERQNVRLNQSVNEVKRVVNELHTGIRSRKASPASWLPTRRRWQAR